MALSGTVLGTKNDAIELVEGYIVLEVEHMSISANLLFSSAVISGLSGLVSLDSTALNSTVFVCCF